MELRRRLLQAAALLAGVVAIGVAGYRVIEPEYTLLDATYMTVITIASVGFGEVHPLSPGGRVFTIFLIMGGTGTLIYGVSTATAFVVEGELTDLLRRRTMEKRIAATGNHYIVCGIGGAGRHVIEELRRTGRRFLIVDPDLPRLRSLDGQDDLAWIHGDPTQGAVLRSAGIERAAGLVSALDTDKDNVFVVLTARDLSPTLRIVALAIEPESDHKLRVAGANEVVQPNVIGGLRVASVLIRPGVVTFLDRMLRDQNRTLRVEEIRVWPGSTVVGRPIGELARIREANALVVALREGEAGEFLFNPPLTRPLAAGDTLVLMGEVQRIDEIREDFQGRGVDESLRPLAQ